MKSTEACILAINGGSSSIKLALFEGDQSLRRVLAGRIERIGRSDAVFVVKGANPADDSSRAVAAADYAAAVRVLMDWIGDRAESSKVVAVGHRIVQGGPNHSAPERLTPTLMDSLRQLGPFDPEHLPEELLLAEAFHRRFPDLTQIACFDTAFHHDMPRVAKLLAIPRRYQAQGVRRYGFHGLSYAYLVQELERVGGPQTANAPVILAHLGSGASMVAVRDGHSFDTTMGFTPASGLMMSTRCGDVDPGLVAFLARGGMNASQFDRMANHESGLLGVSETSADMRDLLAREAEDVRAAEAVALFCYQAKKWLGAYAAVLGGLDTLVFAGGIGENASAVRSRICEGLGFLGIELDATRNAAHADVISTDMSRVTVRVIATDEELMIARSVLGVLHPRSAAEQSPG